MIEAAIRAVVERTLEEFEVPGLVVALARGGGAPEYLVTGSDAAGQPLSRESLFTVASITKLAIALAVLRVVEDGALGLDDELSRHLPDAAAAQPGVSLRGLLSHTSGLPLYLPDEAALYQMGLDWPALAAACLRTPPASPPGVRVQYSNPAYGLLAILLERQSARPIGEVLQALVFEPLGIEAYLGLEPPRRLAVLADVRGPHTGTDLEPFNSPFWRSLGLPWGGLVSTVDGALVLVRAFRGLPSEFLRPETRDEATRNQVGELGGGQIPPLIWPHCPWGLGPELRDEKRPHWAPQEASQQSFGHAGASGCVAWADPEADVAWALLGTRTADGGWLVRAGPRLGAAILAMS